jgi:polysaccharide pyruvyl transferase WcaK-like protein
MIHHDHRPLMTDNTPQVAILGWYGSPNVGDEAALESILSQLATLPTPPRVVVLTTRPTITARRYAHGPLPITVVPRSPFNPRTRRALRASRLLILGGGGLIQDRSSLYNLLPYAAVVRLAHGWGIPTMWWGVGVEPLVTGLGRALARRMVAWSAPGAVSVRDAASRDLLVRAGVPAAALRVTADCAVALPPADAGALAGLLAREGLTLGGAAHVAICLRNLPRDPLGRGPGYLLPVSIRERLTRRLPMPGARVHARRSAYFFDLLAQAADHLITRYGVRVLFVPFWPGRDEAQAAQVTARMRHPEQTHILRGEVPAPVLRALLGEMDAVLALRLHALIFAAAGGVPVLGFSYARKVPAFLAAVGLADRALDPFALDWVRLLHAVDTLWATRAATRRTLLDHMAPLRAAAATDLATAARLLGYDHPAPDVR